MSTLRLTLSRHSSPLHPRKGTATTRDGAKTVRARVLQALGIGSTGLNCFSFISTRHIRDFKLIAA